MSDYKLISSDSHVVEPPDLWQKRIDPKFRDRAPRLVREEDTDQWYADQDFKFGAVGSIAQAGLRFEDPSKITAEGRVENIPVGGYDPHAHVKDMEQDGVAANVLYPTQSFLGYLIPASDLLSAVFRAYNDWITEFCKHYPDRLKGIAIINVDDVAEGVAELERAAGMGLVGGMIPLVPLHERYDHPMYEPLWAAAQDLAMPLSLHVSALRPKAGLVVEELLGDRVVFTNLEFYMRNALAAMIFCGAFERYPKLRVGAVEFEVCWAPFFIMKMDDTYNNRPSGVSGYRYQKDMLPSDFFRRNVFISFQEDAIGMELRHHIGVDNLMWGSDYPHSESTFPKSREIVERILEGVPPDEKAKIAGENCARLYGFN